MVIIRKDYFEDLNTRRTEVEQPENEEEEEIKSLKNNQSREKSGITAKMLKKEGNALEQEIDKVIKRIWGKEEEWSKALIVSLYQKKNLSSSAKKKAKYVFGRAPSRF